MVDNDIYERYGSNISKNHITLLERLRTKIISIDPKIQENFRRYYISYKIGKCFVYLWINKDVIWVYLKTNDSFKDPENLCQKVPKGINATFGKRIRLSKDSLPYIIKLINQSFSIAQHDSN